MLNSNKDGLGILIGKKRCILIFKGKAARVFDRNWKDMFIFVIYSSDVAKGNFNYGIE